MKEEKRIINKLKHKTKNNQKLACSCVYYSCDRAFLMGFYNYTSTNDWWEKNYYNWEKWYLLVVIKKALILKGNKSNPSISLKIAKMLFSNQVNSGKKKKTCTLPFIPPFNNNNNNNKAGVTVVLYRLLGLRHNIATRDILPRETSVPQQQKFHTDDVNQCLHN